MSAPSIALIRQRYNPAGGAERFVERAMSALSRGGAVVTLIARRWSAAGKDDHVVTLDPFYIGRTWRDWSFARAVEHHLRGTRYDLVQSHERMACCDVYRAGDGVHREWLIQRSRTLGALRAALLRASPYHRYVLAQEGRLATAARVRAVICISRMIREEFIRHYAVDPARLPVVYLGVDLDHFHPALRARLRAEQRAALGLKDDDLALLCVGSGFERKGVGTLLHAAAHSASRCHVIVVGDDKRAHRYRTLAQSLGLGARSHFVGVHKDPRPFYAAADAFMMPSLYEPFGNANMEALAMGLPVLTSTKSGVAELLHPGITGFVHDAFDIPGFTRSIAALESPALRDSMGHAARKLAENYSLEEMSRQLIELYTRLLAAPRAA